MHIHERVWSNEVGSRSCGLRIGDLNRIKPDMVVSDWTTGVLWFWSGETMNLVTSYADSFHHVVLRALLPIFLFTSFCCDLNKGAHDNWDTINSYNHVIDSNNLLTDLAVDLEFRTCL